MKKVFLFTAISFIMFSFSGCSGNQDSGKTKKKLTIDNYKKVKIGSQTWMTENLDVSKFRNGESIPKAASIEEWIAAGKKRRPVWCYYENDSKNGSNYGKLYNYYALIDPRGLAPEGWRIPKAKDWKNLEAKLGENPGEKMKSNSGWESDGNGTNESQFTGRPGGYRGNDGKFYFKGQNGYWWILSESNAKNVVCRNLNFKYNFLINLTATKETGFSVRCIKD